MTRKLPPSASVADQGEGAKLVAPAATRNAPVLCDLLVRVAPRSGRALELASGTGQHVVAFARQLPHLHWQPTEIDPARRASIDAYTADVPNVSAALPLDATAQEWHVDFEGQNLIVLVNLLHLISLRETETLIAEAARALVPGGRFMIYGPFMRDGKLTSEGDARFHAALSEQDPDIGYKNDSDMASLLWEAGLNLSETADLPSNNLALIAEKPRI